MLGWEPTIALDEGLRRTIAYFRRPADGNARTRPLIAEPAHGSATLEVMEPITFEAIANCGPRSVMP